MARFHVRRIPVTIDGERPYGLWDTLERRYVDKYGEPVDYSAPPNPKHWGGKHYRCSSRGVAAMRRDYLNYCDEQREAP